MNRRPGRGRAGHARGRDRSEPGRRSGKGARARRPDLIDGIVTLGSPQIDPLAVHPLVRLQVEAVSRLGSLGAPGLFKRSCLEGECCADFWEQLAAPCPDGVGFVSIYSRSDGIVDWRACLDRAPLTCRVSAAMRMAVNPAAWRAVAEALVPCPRGQRAAGANTPPLSLSRAACALSGSVARGPPGPRRPTSALLRGRTLPFGQHDKRPAARCARYRGPPDLFVRPHSRRSARGRPHGRPRRSAPSPRRLRRGACPVYELGDSQGLAAGAAYENQQRRRPKMSSQPGRML